MVSSFLFSFNTDLKDTYLPSKLNNPFSKNPTEIAQLAAQEFQEYIEIETPNWDHDFKIDKGKMFGVLVVALTDGTLAYLATVSGKLKGDSTSDRFTPSVFNDETDDFFINKGMTELTAIGQQIKNSKSDKEKVELTELRKQKSYSLQQRLFENYKFLNIKDDSKNVIEIFKDSQHGQPPAAAGECAAPKLLNFALENSLKPISIAEFWWGLSPKSEERFHKHFYPACKNKCRPILEFMLNDKNLYESVNSEN